MKTNKLIIIIALIFLLTGCWDQVEINDRAYVIALGIDFDGDMLSVAYSFPNLPVITGNGGDGPESFTRVIQAPTLYEANKLFGTRSEKKLTFDHTKIVIFGEGALKEEKILKQVLDQFERDPDFARTLIVFSTEGKASELMEQELMDQRDIGLYLAKLYENNKRDVLKATEIILEDMLINAREKDGTILIPKVIVEEEEPRVEGVGVLIEYTLRDWMGHEDVEKLSWILGKGKGTKIKVPLSGDEVTVEISEMETNLAFEEIAGKLHLKINVVNKGNVMAYTLDPQMSLFENETILQLEEDLNDIMKTQIEEYVKKVQDEYQVDLFNTLDVLAIKSRRLWLQWHDNWNEVFSNATYEVEVRTNIRRIGVAK